MVKRMRKKIIGMVLVIALYGLTACAGTDGKKEQETTAKQTEEVTTPQTETETQTEIVTEEETTTVEETTTAEETTTVEETTVEETQATAAQTTAQATEAATTAATEAATLGKNPYVYRGGYELETDAKTGELVVDANGYYTKLGLQKPLTVKKNDKGGSRIDVYGEEPGPYFILDLASYSSKPTLAECTLGEGVTDKEAKLVNSWWGDNKKLNVVLWCKQCPVNCLYVLDLAPFTSQIKEKEDPIVTKKEITIVFKYSEEEKYEFKVEAISKQLLSSTAKKAKLISLTEDDQYYYFDLTSTETGDFRAKYNKTSGKIALEFS